jgi:tetratricopeptide (TPR) repeat protein
MTRQMAKSTFVLLALALWILACPASQSDDDEFNLLNQQVQTLFKRGKYQEAIPIAEKAAKLAKRVYSPQHTYTARSLNNLGVLYQATGQYAKAERLLQQALRIRQKVLGPENPDTAASLNNLGDLYREMGEYAKAEPLYQEALRIWQKVLGPEHRETVTGLDNFALLEFDLGRIDEATALGFDRRRSPAG